MPFVALAVAAGITKDQKMKGISGHIALFVTALLYV